jgi:hypothetical protein
MMVNYEIKFSGGDILDISILAIIEIVAFVAIIPLMYLIRYLVIEKKESR